MNLAVEPDQITDWSAEIRALSQSKKALILAHYYQRPEIQEVAHFVGDSLALAQKAAAAGEAEIIVFAGVHFMAETAKIINPTKKVFLPDLRAGCSLADSCPPEAFRTFVQAHPQHVVVSYINASAEVKALSDWVCTSSNAEKVIGAIPANRAILFAPDKNLGRYLMEKTGREMLLWEGACTVHEAFDLEKIIRLKQEHPEAQLIAHPESESPILRVAKFVGSTAALLHYVEEDHHSAYIVATEPGILHRMRNQLAHKKFIPAPARENNSCACSECAFMKINTLEKLRNCLRDESPEIILPESLALAARRPIERMLQLSATLTR